MAYEITAVRTTFSDDATHQHIDLVGYESPHTPGEPITVPTERIATKIAFGESYAARDGDELIEVKLGKCSICGHEPELVTAKDTKDRRLLLELKRI